MAIKKDLSKKITLLILVLVFVFLGWLKWNSSQNQSQIEPLEQPRWLLFHSAKCEACIKMEALSEELKDEYVGKVEFIDVDIDKVSNERIVSEYKISFIPTSVFEVEGAEPITHIGALPEKKLRELLDNMVKNDE
jgi:thioredoxin-like negative regulator of GroEL